MAEFITRSPKYESKAEKRVVEALVDQLPANWFVAQSVKWVECRHGTRTDGECDAVAFCSEGIVTIEVKGGKISRDGSNRFFSTDSGGTRHQLALSPVKQALRAKYAIRDRLRQIGLRDTNFSHAVVFPDCDSSAPTAGRLADMDLEEGVLIDGPALGEIGDRVRNLLANGDKEPMSPKELDCVREILEPTWSLGGALKIEAGRNVDEAAELTEQQHRTLQGLWSNPRVVVTGCAGSGKSVLALRIAGELAVDDRRSLYVCFNRPLAQEQQRAVERAGLSDRVRATTFHSLVEDWLKALGIETGPRPASGDKRGWTEFFDRMVEVATEEAAIHESFDAIVIDEGQDFNQEWVDFLECALTDQSESTFIMFMDPAQNIYRPDNMPGISGAMDFPLSVNCRNRGVLAKSISELLGDPPATYFFEGGSPVETIDCATTDEADEALRQMLHRLTHDENLDPGDIVVQTLAGSGATRYHGRKFGNLTLVGVEPNGYETPTPGPNEVLLESVRRFKGLETPATILVESEAVPADQLTPLLRVGLTRAINFAAWIRVSG